MLTAAAIVLAFFVLPAPWSWAVLAAAVTIDGVELGIWLRMRRRRALTGPDALIGSKGVALTDCRPEGEVRVQGQIWKACCPVGVAAGTTVTIVGVRELVLEVVPETTQASARPPRP